MENANFKPTPFPPYTKGPHRNRFLLHRLAFLLLAVPTLGLAAPEITGVEFIGPVYRTGYGDNWYTTWADDGRQYTSLDDGTTLTSTNRCDQAGKTLDGLPIVNNRVLRLQGDAPHFVPQDLPGYPFIGKVAQWYGFGILAMDSHLYHFVTYSDPGKGLRFLGSKLVHSPNLGKTWRDNDDSPLTWPTRPDRSKMFWWDERDRAFAVVTILQMGQGYRENTDGYVYVYGNHGVTKDSLNRMVMARVPKDRVRTREAYEYFAILNPDGSAQWTNHLAHRGVALTFPAGWTPSNYDHSWVPSVIYLKPLRQYLLAACGMARNEGNNLSAPTCLRIYRAPNPWGPWTQIHADDAWIAGGDPASRPYSPVFAPRWVSPDGRSLWLIFSDGKGFGPPWNSPHCLPNYSFNLQQLRLVVN